MNLSVNDLYNFLDHVENKAILPKNTASSRKTACKSFFEGLDEKEQNLDHIEENFDILYKRFCNHNATKYKGQSLEVYKSRVRKALDDFFSWKQDPAAWERSLTSRGTKSTTQAKSKKPDLKVEKPSSKLKDEPTTRRLSLPIRPDFEVKIEIPENGLSRSELHRLGMFLFPYCSDLNTETWDKAQWPMIVKTQD